MKWWKFKKWLKKVILNWNKTCPHCADKGQITMYEGPYMHVFDCEFCKDWHKLDED